MLIQLHRPLGMILVLSPVHRSTSGGSGSGQWVMLPHVTRGTAIDCRSGFVPAVVLTLELTLHHRTEHDDAAFSPVGCLRDRDQLRPCGGSLLSESGLSVCMH
ncbi:hypothetical protein NDU88_002450 [Pleurodeles waltl]|uniref:Secreted protein n=1 Tax=Pleurodeles waltl TaxID=8319 RepID=A0AAV7UVN6_PLEWA|nr:hypothetical protein NDU88_002450 [Pleurodeles waltl]